jgi:hypothetical protein
VAILVIVVMEKTLTSSIEGGEVRLLRWEQIDLIRQRLEEELETTKNSH